jgi:hypothetical protein
MSVASAVQQVKEEAGLITATIRDDLSTLNFALDSLVSIKDKYTQLSREILGLTYDQLAELRKLPPVDPDTNFDQVRLGLIEIMALGDIFFPLVPTGNNIKAVQEFYLSAGENLVFVGQRLDDNPPGRPATDTFDLTINKFNVTTTGTRNPDGTLKTRDQIAEEFGSENFEMFLFPQIPQLAFIVAPEFLGANTKLGELSRRLAIPTDQFSLRAVWYGHINPTSTNFSKMKVTLGLTNPQIRSASFGDDLARSNSSVFNLLIDTMEARFNFSGSSLPSPDALVKILDAVQQDALTFLAQATFGTTLIVDRDAVNDAREGGVTSAEMEFALDTRNDINFIGADLNANNLRTTVFPQTSNFEERRTTGFALQQDPDTLRFTNNALNQSTDFRALMVTASKRVVASAASHQIVIGRENVSEAEITQALLGVSVDIAALRSSYNNFLTPPSVDPERVRGSRTAESANNMLSRACNLVESLRIKDQLENFPTDFDGGVDDDLQLVLDGLVSLSSSIENYLSVYRSGEIRDFLAYCVSVASTTNLLLADGEPDSSLIVAELPATIEQFRTSIQEILLDDENSRVLFNSVSIQVGAFVSVLRGNSDNDPVGRLLDLPITVLDALLPSNVEGSYSIPLENGQEEALVQVRDSFDSLRGTVTATIRDLGVYRANFGCAMNDAEFFVARLAGDSVRNLVTELRQS